MMALCYEPSFEGTTTFDAGIELVRTSHRPVVHEPVDDGVTEDGVTEDSSPIWERSVRRDNGGVTFFVAGVDDLEEHCARFGAADREEPDVVNHQDDGCSERLHLGRQVPLDRRSHKWATEVVGGGEIAAIAGLDCECGKRDGEVCFAAARLSQEEDRPVLVNKRV
jgi:hypothetical protein